MIPAQPGCTEPKNLLKANSDDEEELVGGTMNPLSCICIENQYVRKTLAQSGCQTWVNCSVQYLTRIDDIK